MARGEYCIMAYWLEIGSDNIVKNCVKTPDNINENWCVKNLGYPSGGVQWMEQTSERGGGIGDTYVSDKNWFKKPQPHANWTYDDTNNSWNAPFQYTTDTYDKNGVQTVYDSILWNDNANTWLATTAGAIPGGPYGYQYLWNNETSHWDLKSE